MAGCVAATPVFAVESDDLTGYLDQSVMRIDTRESCLAAGVDLRLRDGMGRTVSYEMALHVAVQMGDCH